MLDLKNPVGNTQRNASPTPLLCNLSSCYKRVRYMQLDSKQTKRVYKTNGPRCDLS